MHVELCHGLTPDVDVLYLLRRDVLALRQLEDVLLPIDDFERAVLQDIDTRRVKAAWFTDMKSIGKSQRLLTDNHLPMSPV